MGAINFEPLKSGDAVALIAPARSVTEEEMAPFLDWLRNLGLQPVLGKNLFGKFHQFSGRDEERADDFIAAWTDPKIRAVFCGRGGYGCLRLMPYLTKDVLAKGAGKILVGYSDVTTLHLALGNLGMASVHGPMAINFFDPKPGSQANFDFLEQLLFTGTVNYSAGNSPFLNKAAFEGVLTGGNLSLLYAALGTPEQPDTRGKVLFLEDLDEYLYHIDRMVVSLDRAGIFSGLAGLIVGSMTEMKDNATPFGQNVQQIIETHTQKYGFPVWFDFPAGHGLSNYSLKMNAYTTFDGKILRQI